MSAPWWMLIAALALTGVLGWWWRRRNGVWSAPGARAGDFVLSQALIGTELGSAATFVQFSSEVCQPCRATARVLRQLSAQKTGVVHVELDIADHLELVSTLGVMRTPTVFAVAPDGHIVGRASGAMTAAQARETLDALVPLPPHRAV